MRKILLWTTEAEMNDPLVVLQDAGVPTPETDPRTGLAITEPFTEYGDSSHRNRHLNIFKIQNFVVGTTSRPYRTEQHFGVDTKEITVTNNGVQNIFEVNGTDQATINLIQGHVYHFNHPTGHPFRLSTTADGTHGGGVEYTTGVHVRGDNILELRTDENTPSQLYYYCSLHSGMGGVVGVAMFTRETSIAIDTADHDYLVRSNERRPSYEGRIVSSGSQQDEVFLLEDGYKFIYEEEKYFFGLEPTLIEQVFRSDCR